MSEDSGRPTRRSVLAGAGAAVGVAVAAGGSVPAEAETRRGGVATADRGETAAEFRGRITQSGDTGEEFTAHGFLTVVRGLTGAELFAGPSTDVSTARYTLVATGRLVQRVLDRSVHALDIAGELVVYHRDAPGADFGDPASFAVGQRLARFQLTLQDVLTVFAPASGIPTLTGDMRQGAAEHLADGRRFGRRGQELRMFATGLGFLTDPVTLNAELEIAGNWTAT